MFNRGNGCGCVLVWLIALIVGIIVGVNSYAAIIPGIVNVLWIAFGLGSATLITILLITLFAKYKHCLCNCGKYLVISAFGTIITAIIALAITIVATSIPIAVLLGAVAFFLTGTIVLAIKLWLCLIERICGICQE